MQIKASSGSGGAGGSAPIGGGGGGGAGFYHATAAVGLRLPHLDDLRMHRALLEVHASWLFRLLPKDLRTEILNLIGEAQ